MASPFPKAPAESSTRRIKAGIELKDFRDEQGIILPSKDASNTLITSALPYVNNAPHLGNIIGSTLSADVFARYSRQRNQRTLYICGTDEYGTTTEVMAAKEGVSPQELCDKYHKIHADSYEWFEIGFDHFGRTSTPKQTEICQDIFLKLYNNGWLEEHENQQLYCEKDKRFLADRYVEGTCPKCHYDGARGDQCEHCSVTYESPLELVNPRCSACGARPDARTTAHLHLKLAELQPQIEAFVERASSEGTWSANGKAFTDGWLRGGLQSRGMTRDLEWGVRLPKELGAKWENKVMYVWFDAPIGYPSITANYTDEWKQWWRDPEHVKLYQFMGKDNVPFHTVLFPGYLLGSGDNWTMLNSISTTEYLQYEGTKFSKSKNVGVFGINARESGVPASVWRYYLLMNRPETNDSEFTWDNFVALANAELLNNLGNFVNRVVKFAVAKFGGVVPDPKHGAYDASSGAYPFAAEDEAFVADVDRLLATYNDQLSHQKLRGGLQTLLAVTGRGNQFLQDNRLDNALLEHNPARCAEVVLVALNVIYVVAALTHPYMPSTSDSILAQLDAVPRSIPDELAIDLLPGHRLGEPKHLFARIDPKNVAVWRAKYGGDAAKKAVGAGDAAATANKPLSRKQQDKLKKEAKKAADAAAAARPRSDEELALEALIKSQGDKIRRIKQGGEAHEGDRAVEDEVASLKALKEELDALTKSLAGVSI
ncbi:hypothetical protein JCM3775_006466 [Rhodotorula graminis]